MLYISYQGVFDGQNFDKANTPQQITNAFNAGYSCMVDVWRIDGILYIGTGQPVIEVTPKYLQTKRFWINALNTEMQEWIVTQPAKLYPNYFWFNNVNENNPTTASGGQIITPGTIPISNSSILFLPEINDRGLFSTVHVRCYGICSSYLSFIKRMRNEGVYY